MTPLSDWRVLIVEDEADSMEVIRTLLGFQGIATVGARTAEAALAELQDLIPTLIVVDLSLPGMNGWDLLQAIQRDARLADVPRVAVSAYHSLELAGQAIAAGFNAYFPKPLEATSFVRELQYVVEGA